MAVDHEPVDRLEGTSGGKGGLVVKKKTKSDDQKDNFKKPSIYGLEKRAKEKREERSRESERER